MTNVRIASSIVINVINSFASKYGQSIDCVHVRIFLSVCSLFSTGSPGEKGTILGIFRSLQALARAIGPLTASIGKITFDILLKQERLPSIAYWSIGERTTYLVGSLLLLCPLALLIDVQHRFKRMNNTSVRSSIKHEN
jgi:hypothetical protein